MTTEASPFEPRGGETCAPPNEFAEEVGGGQLFIRDLPATSMRRPDAARLSADADDEGEEKPDDEDVMTTLMLGEEGRGEEKSDPSGEGGCFETTLALGEEGDRGL